MESRDKETERRSKEFQGTPSDMKGINLNPTNQIYLDELYRRDHQIEEQKKVIANLRKELDRQSEQIENLTTELEKKERKSNSSNSDNNTKQSQSRYWTADEHQKYLEAVERFGEKDVKSIAAYVGSRNATQVRTHGQKYYLRLERERKRREEEGRNSDGSAPSTPTPSADGDDKQIIKKEKKASNSKRRKSFDSPQSMASGFNSPIASPIQNSPPAPSSFPKDPSKGIALNPVIPAFIQQQIAAETKASVLTTLRGSWSPEEYNAFIEGLVAYSEEKDINTRCTLIARHYLPRYAPEQIKQCFMVLSNVAKAKERDEPRDELAGMVEARVRAELYGQYHLLLKPDTEMQARYYKYPQPAYPQFNESMVHTYAGASSFNGMQSAERRPSYSNLDQLPKSRESQEAFLSLEQGALWSHPNTEEFQPLNGNDV